MYSKFICYSRADVDEQVVSLTFNTEEQVREKTEEDCLPGPSKPTFYCLCKKEDDQLTPMIMCDSNCCSILWYHLKCVGLTEETIPKDT